MIKCSQYHLERSAIEQQYASRLADLAETPIGKNELPYVPTIARMFLLSISILIPHLIVRSAVRWIA